MDYEDIKTEVKEDCSPFFEFTWEFLQGLTKYAKVSFYTKDIDLLRVVWKDVLQHEEAIRPILAECRELMA